MGPPFSDNKTHLFNGLGWHRYLSAKVSLAGQALLPPMTTFYTYPDPTPAKGAATQEQTAQSAIPLFFNPEKFRLGGREIACCSAEPGKRRFERVFGVQNDDFDGLF
jgi:hypothetical protein